MVIFVCHLEDAWRCSVSGLVDVVYHWIVLVSPRLDAWKSDMRRSPGNEARAKVHVSKYPCTELLLAYWKRT